MQILGNGINYSTGKLLIDPLDEMDFADKILGSLRKNSMELSKLTRATTGATTFRGEIERCSIDLGDPRAAGWTFLINSKDPRRNKIVENIRTLAEHRGMENPEEPLFFNNESLDEWFDWMNENYFSAELGMKKIPHYILIVGSPDQVPFHFQSFLDSAASVGRIDFDSLDDMNTYIEKVINLENSADPVVAKETAFFAPDGGPDDPTHYSRLYMAKPLAEHVRKNYKFETCEVMGDEATKDNFLKNLGKLKPALVYTASHGLGAPDESLDIQKQFNGAICCQNINNQPIDEWLFAGKDVPLDDDFLYGSVFFQFACYGYGTPAESDFEHWLGDSKMNSEADFVAALPKSLLSHPKGPIAYVGHVDTAWLHGFADPDNPDTLERWNPRIEPFVKAVDMLLQVQPVGLAMGDMNKRYDLGNALLTNTFDRIQKGKLKMTPELQGRFANAFITRSDAQNYMVFGDPAVRLRIPT